MEKTNRTQKKLLLLLDAHAIIHRAYHALPDFATRGGIPTGALYGFASMIFKIFDDFNPDYLVACYDLPGKTFRHEAYDNYKGTRSKTDDALTAQFQATRELCGYLGIPIYDTPGFEADDMLGTIAEQMKSEQDLDIVIASGDMDTLQLVEGTRVRVFTLKRGLNDTVIYDENAVHTRFGFGPERIPDYKGLRGDPSDNIPGVKGIGEKAAELILQNFENIENCYAVIETSLEQAKERGLSDRIINLLQEGKENAEFSKILATIRRDAPITFTLPEHSWRESIVFDELQNFFDRYEFRGLRDRVNKLRNSDSIETKTSREHENFETPTVNAPAIIDEQQLHLSSIALWVLDADYKEASLEDILFYTKETVRP